MANKEEWRKPAKINEKYIIGVMAIAPMNEIPKVKNSKWTKLTGKARKNEVTSQELDEGVTIIAENGGKEETTR